MRFTVLQFHALGYFIAVDHRTDAVVLSLRGSTTLDDWMTDAVASYTPFLEGFAHKVGRFNDGRFERPAPTHDI